MAEPDDDSAEVVETVDVGDPEQVKQRETALHLQERERKQFWHAIFATEVGRREMWAILDAGKAFQPSFGVGPNGFPQPEASWFNAGMHDYAHRLFLSWLKADRDGVVLMLEENEPRIAKPKPKPRRTKPKP